MQKFLGKAKAHFGNDGHDEEAQRRPQQHQNQQPTHDQPSSIAAPSPADVARYRYHHGCNFGSVFVLERWLTGHMFPEGSQGSSELAAVQAWVKQEGIEKAKQRFEKHWREYIRDSDLDWLRDGAKCTTVRLPIGYWDLGPPYCEGTPFKPVAGVYENAWNAVKNLIRRCHERGMGVLIDMHGLPGGANAQDHSGTNSGKAEFWSTKGHRELATRCLLFIAQQVKGMEGVAGIQVINEAEYNAKHMYDWYEHVLDELSSVDPTMPIYVSDAWDLNRCATWAQGRNSAKGRNANPVVIDTHLYWCFGEADKAKAPQQIIQDVSGKLSPLDGKDGDVQARGAVQAFVGEYSCVLDGSTWAKSQGAPKDQLVRQFGNAESQRFQQRAGGSTFWTYRMDWMPGGEWGFKQMTEAHAIVPPRSLTLSAQDVHNAVQNAQAQQQQKKDGALQSHVNYWDSNYPGQYEHHRFAEGYDIGFSDATAFFEMRSHAGKQGGDKIGMLELWVLKRLRESGQGGKFVWEFEQGLRQGVRDLYGCVNI